jgi:hypothetical protein
MSFIPYKKCLYELGDIGITDISGKNIMWTYHNVFFNISQEGDNIDLKGLSKQIQEYSKKIVVNNIDDNKPEIKDIIISNKKIKIGDGIEIHIIPEMGEMYKNQDDKNIHEFMMDCRMNGDKLSKISNSDLNYKFLGVKEGREKITFILGDKYCLLCSKYEIELEVTK